MKEIAMIKPAHLLLPLFMGALGACATTTPKPAANVAAVDAKVSEVETTADTLTQTKRTAQSADGEMVCKRVTVVGSRFHKKVCGTTEEWAARAAADRQTTEGIQRSAGPGVSN